MSPYARITVKRYPYEDPYNVNLHFSATDGLFSGFLEYYCNADDLKDIGDRLSTFPTKIGDEYKYEIGSSDPKDNSAYHFILRAFTTDRKGHCALEITMNNNRQSPHGRFCSFSIQTETAAINRLGQLFEKFSKLEHRQFVWTETDESITADIDPAVERTHLDEIKKRRAQVASGESALVSPQRNP